MNRVYTSEFTSVCAPDGDAPLIFYINNSNRECYLKSIFFDIRIAKDGAPFNPLPLEQNNTQLFYFSISAMPYPSLFASAVSDISIPNNVIRNGNEIALFRPGQYHWNSFFVKDILRFTFSYHNGDAAITYKYYGMLVAEIEDKKIKYAS